MACSAGKSTSPSSADSSDSAGALGRQPAAVSPLLSVEGLLVELRRERCALPVLRDVSLSLPAGRAHGLVGESGSGKTLAALAIMGLLGDRARIAAGAIRFRGEDLRRAGPRRWRALRGHGMAMVLQDPLSALDPVRRVGEPIAESLRLHRHLDVRGAREEAVVLLNSVGLPDARRAAAAYPHELSGGMRQRALLAAALAGDPSLLVADEPTTALDAAAREQILTLLDHERSRRGLALLLVSHDLSLVARHCDDGSIVYAGRIVEAGPTGRLFSTPRHPYTAGLVEAGLALDRPRRAAGHALPVIPGSVLPVERFGEPGCAFHERCPRADSACAVTPPWSARLPGEGFACHHPLEAS